MASAARAGKQAAPWGWAVCRGWAAWVLPAPLCCGLCLSWVLGGLWDSRAELSLSYFRCL